MYTYRYYYYFKFNKYCSPTLKNNPILYILKIKVTVSYHGCFKLVLGYPAKAFNLNLHIDLKTTKQCNT